jgi:ABC-2 type transport system ATP-binding protein
MIKIENLTHSLGENTVLEGLDLNISDGTILGLVGINGAGKSTLLRLMAGVYKADKGSITYDGESPEKEKTRERIFFLPDDPYFTGQATMKSVLKMYKTFYKIDLGFYEKFIKEFALDENKPLRTFSKGMRRQAYIAIALAIRPKYLLLDEAFDGLDPLARHRVKSELIRMVEDDGATVVISSHSLRELEDFCDSFAVIDGKRVSSSGDIAEKVGGYCSFMLAFTVPVEEGVFDGLPLVKAYKNGKFIKATFEGNADEIEEKLKTHSPISPAVIERMTVDFEEVFINEVSRKESV